MFFDTVEDLHSKFKLFDRLNTLVFGIWKDKSALEYRDGALQDLRILYMNYINEMRQQCNELEQLNREVSEAFDETQHDLSKLDHIKAFPSINGCYSVNAFGALDEDGTTDGVEEFVVGWNELNDIELLAPARCKKLYTIEEVSLGNPL